MNVRGDQVEPVLLGKDPQKQDHGAATTLTDPVVHHLAGEGQHLWYTGVTENITGAGGYGGGFCRSGVHVEHGVSIRRKTDQQTIP